MSICVRPITADELETFQQTMGVPFSIDPTPSLSERFRATFELPRLRAAYDGDTMVATFGAFSFQMAVPGAVLPTAGTTVVTVLPTHRRQGIFRKLMTEHLAEVHAAGEPLAALWASESSIYGRFGYGPASERSQMKLEKPYAVLARPVNIREAMRLVERDEALRVFPQIYAQVAAARPGMFQRNETWWTHRVLADAEESRKGATTHRRVLHVRDDRPAGYAIFRTHAESFELRVLEVTGLDAEAERALWQFLLGIDLVKTITYWNQPTDDPLRWWLADPRRMERQIEDALWVRAVDVAAALAGRRYACAGSLTFRICDEVCPWNDGVYRLEADASGAATCRRHAGEAELDLSPYALGAAYLGGSRLSELARAGLVGGSREAVRRADAMFSWHPAPWCQEVF